MRFITLALFTTFCILSSSLGQKYSNHADSLNIPVAAFWQKGDVFHYRVIKTKYAWVDKKITEHDSANYLAKCTILNEDSVSYTIEWKFRNSLFDSIDIPASERKKLSIYDSVKVIYRTNEMGIFEGIINWQDFGNMVREYMTALKNSEESNLKDAKTAAYMDSFINSYSSRQNIENSLMKELQIMHIPYGKVYKTGKQYHYQTTVANPLGGNPVKYNGFIGIRNLDTINSVCHIIQRLTVLSPDAKNALIEYMYNSGVKLAALDQTLSESKYQIYDNNFFDISYNNGVIIRAGANNTVEIKALNDDVRKIEYTFIEKTDP